MNEEFEFWKGHENILRCESGQEFDRGEASERVRSHLAEAVSARNVSFLFGSGCSSFRDDQGEQGIPTMGPLARSFFDKIDDPTSDRFVSADDQKALMDWLDLDLKSEKFSGNLERLMEALFGAKFVLDGASAEGPASLLAVVNRVIEKVSNHVLSECSSGPFSQGNDSVLELYQEFYQKLLFRDRSLPRPWIFTTNYDLFSERAMDRLGVPYGNGFSGVIERRFNPALFRYSLAEQLDLTNRKWAAVDSFVYLCKLHGSINWIEDGETLFPVRELASGVDKIQGNQRVMIYPTPAKQSASFVSPYSDLFREFQSRIVRDQSVLVTVGYSFGDEHVNNIIFQALTVPNFRLIAFVPPDAAGIVGKLKQLKDPRIWLIGSDSYLSLEPAHYFKAFVREFMPEMPGVGIEEAVSNAVRTLMGKPSIGSKEG